MLKGIWARWREMRNAERAARLAAAFAALQTGRLVVGDAKPVCNEVMPGFHDPDCDCQGLSPARCGRRMTKRQFLLHGRCVECMNSDKQLANR